MQTNFHNILIEIGWQVYKTPAAINETHMSSKNIMTVIDWNALTILKSMSLIRRKQQQNTHLPPLKEIITSTTYPGIYPGLQ